MRHLLFVLLMTACTGDEAEVCVLSAPSTDRLDVPTGYRELQAPVDAPWLSEARTVPVGLWYNTDATSGDTAEYMGAFPDESALDGAPFFDLAPGCKLPLVIYSHGSQAWGGNASPLLRHLVAQGWIAAAPDHLGNTLLDNVEPRPISFSLTRVADLRATLDAIEALPAEDPLFDRVDTSRVLLLGHSFGGQTSWLMSGPTFDTDTLAERCATDAAGCTAAELAAFDTPAVDPRVVAVLPMDGFAGIDLVAPEGWASAERPILYLARSHDGDEEPFATAAAAADLTWARFEDACHETFTSTQMPCDTFDKEEGLDLVAAYLTAFAAEQILGVDTPEYSGILDGSTVLDERVTLRHSGD